MSGRTKDYQNEKLTGNLNLDIAIFKEIFKNESALRIKYIRSRNKVNYDCALIYIDGMINGTQINDSIIKPIITVDAMPDSEDLTEYIEKQVLFARDIKKKSLVSDILEGVLYGEVLLLISGSLEALLIDSKGWRTRGISEPKNETVLQGPREGFDEAALLNVAMIRRKLQTPDFCTEMLRIGRRSSTIVFICYLNTLTDKKILSELKRKLEKIDIDGILDSNYISEQIRADKFSLFSTIGSTERPDIIASKLLEGRIAVVVDGTPVVLTLPYLFSENFQSDEDYYLNFLFASSGRILRYISFFLSISIPAIFISLLAFHTSLLPTSLAIAIARLRGGVPFSPSTECIIMLFVFEALREAGLRMSQNLGHTLSVVGGLVVGQAAVEARIISTPMLIVIALSGICGLMVPKLRSAVLYLRIALLIASALFGLYGFFIGISIIIMHIISLSSFGVDYTVSLRKSSFQSLKDTIIRADFKKMLTRPLFNFNLIRQKRYKK